MLVATFGPSTGWNGKTITYDASVFTLEGQGPIGAADVMAYDAQGHLIWTAGGTRAWVASQAQGSTAAGAAGHQSATRQATKRRYLLVVTVTIAALFALAAVVAAFDAAQSYHQAAAGAGSAYEQAADTLKAHSGTLVQVFSWPGGGPSNDIRNSAPFTLEGGHQVFTVTATPIGGEYSIPSLGWVIKAADGHDGMEMVNPSSIGNSQSDLYLPAGSYYVASNTIDCNWTVTITEER